MKTRLLIWALVSLFSSTLLAQNFQDIVKEVKESKNAEDLDEICQSVYLGFTNTPEEVDNLVSEIISTAGVKRSFELKECANISNAVAKNLFIDGVEKRYIIYDAEWMKQMASKTNNDWTGKLILAHEIGHHMNGHSMNNGTSTPEVELEADYFAGRALSHLGAELEDIIAVTESMSVNASSSHPGRADRRAQLEAGFKSVASKEITLRVEPKDIDQIGLNMMVRVKDNLKNGSMDKEGFSKTLQILNRAKDKYYKGKYTEDMRYYEAMIYTGLGDEKSATNAYINYLSIENLDKSDRIKQVAGFFAGTSKNNTAFFSNPNVVFQLSKAHYKLKHYKKAIAFGNQFLGQSLDESKKSSINQLIADSEVNIIMEGEDGLSVPEMVDQGILYLRNSDYEKALDYLRKGAEKGNSEAQYHLATMYYKGNGVSRDVSQATRLFLEAAQDQNVEAQYMTGKLYYDRNDNENALFWLERAKSNGNTDAATLIDSIERKKLDALRREESVKTEKKEEKAKVETLAMKMVKANSFFDQEMYSDAFSNYIDAANKGDAKAQSRVAWMLYKGKGVSKDKKAAYDWWRKAARQGDTESINYLTRLGKW